jgi:hypothetical protein
LLFDTNRQKNPCLTPYCLSSPRYCNLAGFPVKNSFNILRLQHANKAQHTWLDMFLTESLVTTAHLDVSVPVRTGSRNTTHVAHGVLQDPRGLTSRTIMERTEEIFQSDIWRTTYRYRFCEPGLATVGVSLFAGESEQDEHETSKRVDCLDPT